MSKQKVIIDLKEYEDLKKIKKMVEDNCRVTSYYSHNRGIWSIASESDMVNHLATKVKHLEFARDNRKWWKK